MTSAGGDLVIIGAGGFGRETADAVRAANAAGGSWRNRKLRYDFLLVRYRPNGRIDR